MKNIFHHLGKAYRRNGDCDNARECFEKVLSIKSNNYETWNQIVNLGSTKNVSKELQNIAFLLYLGVNTIWYLHSHFVWLSESLIFAIYFPPWCNAIDLNNLIVSLWRKVFLL